MVQGPTALVAGIVTFASFFGIAATNLHPATPWVVIGVTTLWIIIQSLPRVYLHPADYMNKRLSLADLDKMLLDIPRVGLMGSSSVGKSTFLSRVSHFEGPSQETEAPYAVIVALPDQNKGKYIALIDTVGRKYPSASQVISDSDAVIVFLDNSSRSGDELIASNRMKMHREIVASNITPSLEVAEKCKYVLVLVNKADLWGGNSKSCLKMSRFANEIRDQLSSAIPGKIIEILDNHSNLNGSAVSAVLRRVGEKI